MRRQFIRLLDDVLVGPVSKSLAMSGFRGGGRRWRRDLPECIQMIAAEVHSESATRERMLRFSVHLSVYSKPIEQLLGRNVRKRPAQASFHWNVSLRSLCAPSQSPFFLLDETSEAADVAVDVVDKLTRFGLPCLEEAKTLSGFAALLTAVPPVGTPRTKQLAALALKALQRDEEAKVAALQNESAEETGDFSEKFQRFMALL
jgi:hypothetical protein